MTLPRSHQRLLPFLAVPHLPLPLARRDRRQPPPLAREPRDTPRRPCAPPSCDSRPRRGLGPAATSPWPEALAAQHPSPRGWKAPDHPSGGPRFERAWAACMHLRHKTPYRASHRGSLFDRPCEPCDSYGLPEPCIGNSASIQPRAHAGTIAKGAHSRATTAPRCSTLASIRRPRMGHARSAPGVVSNGPRSAG